MMRFIVLCLMIMTLTLTWGQAKKEVEKRIDVEDVPQEAVEDLSENVEEFENVKWYYQEDGLKRVFEAKFKQFSQKYSVEFDTLGKIYNVEIVINKKQIPKKAYEQMVSYLEAEFDDYKFRKIQREHLGEADDLFDLIEDNERDDDLTIKYEVKVNGKIDKRRALYEISFDAKGEVLNRREVVLQSTDILDY